MPNRATARAWDAQESPDEPRSWISHVPFDQLEDDENVFVSPNKRAQQAQAASAATAQLRAVPRQAVPAAMQPAPRARATARQVETLEQWEHVAPTPQPAAKTGRLPALAPQVRPSAQAASTPRLAMYGAAAFIAVIVLYAALSAAVHQVQLTMDDLAYGRPRTTHLQAVVGHNDSVEQPSNFIALNLNRQVTVFEIPGGDTAKATVINGPYLFGEGEDLTPVHLEVADMNGDGKNDLLVSVKDEELVYINDNNTFRALSADERAKLLTPGSGGGPSK